MEGKTTKNNILHRNMMPFPPIMIYRCDEFASDSCDGGSYNFTPKNLNLIPFGMKKYSPDLLLAVEVNFKRLRNF